MPAGPINSVSEAVKQVDLVTHDHPAGDGVVKTAPLPFHIDGARRAAERPPPVLGAHTDEVLGAWRKNK